MLALGYPVQATCLTLVNSSWLAQAICLTMIGSGWFGQAGLVRLVGSLALVISPPGYLALL
jgi:hypothetical protein